MEEKPYFCRKYRVMQYHVTCNKCKRTFTITSEGGERMRCTCPYCGQPLLVNLPAVVQPVMSPGRSPVRPQRGNDGHLGVRIIMTVLVVLVLGGLGAFGFIEWQRQQESARLELQAQRKAHADSLMRVRARQEAVAAEEQRKEEQRRAVCRFLQSFYEKAVLTDEDPSFYERYLTSYCRQMVFGVDAENSDVDKWTAWWGAFGSMAESPDFAALKQNLRVLPAEGNWYRVRLSQEGITEFRHVKVSTTDGHVLIDDVR